MQAIARLVYSHVCTNGRETHIKTKISLLPLKLEFTAQFVFLKIMCNIIFSFVNMGIPWDLRTWGFHECSTTLMKDLNIVTNKIISSATMKNRKLSTSIWKIYPPQQGNISSQCQFLGISNSFELRGQIWFFKITFIFSHYYYTS